MVAVVFVPATAQRSLQVVAVVVNQRSHSTIEVVFHLLLAHQVALYNGLIHQLGIVGLRVVGIGCPQTIAGPFGINLILLVVALTPCIVQAGIKAQVMCQILVQQQLIVLLVVVICLFVVEHIVVPRHSATRVEAAAIDRLLVF